MVISQNTLVLEDNIEIVQDLVRMVGLNIVTVIHSLIVNTCSNYIDEINKQIRWKYNVSVRTKVSINVHVCSLYVTHAVLFDSICKCVLVDPNRIRQGPIKQASLPVHTGITSDHVASA